MIAQRFKIDKPETVGARDRIKRRRGKEEHNRDTGA